MHGADKNLSVHVYIYFFAKLSALCTKRTIIIDIQHVAQCIHYQKPYAPLCAHAYALCEFTTKRERFYGIGRQKKLFVQQNFRSPYTIKPLSFLWYRIVHWLCADSSAYNFCIYLHAIKY